MKGSQPENENRHVESITLYDTPWDPAPLQELFDSIVRNVND